MSETLHLVTNKGIRLTTGIRLTALVMYKFSVLVYKDDVVIDGFIMIELYEVQVIEYIGMRSY